MKRLAVIGTACVAVFAAVAVGCWMPGHQVPISHRMTPENPNVRLAGEDERLEATAYRVGIKDVLMVEVKRHPEFSGKMTVDSNGRIMIPLIRTKIPVDGLSLAEITEHVKATLERYVMQAPEVDVEVYESNSKVYYVLGAVATQGKFKMGTEVIRLREALLRASLQSDIAASDKVCVIEPDVDDPKYVVINAEEILYGRLRYNIVLKPNDIVFVPSTVTKKINDFVKEFIGKLNDGKTIDTQVNYFKERFEGAKPTTYGLQ